MKIFQMPILLAGLAAGIPALNAQQPAGTDGEGPPDTSATIDAGNSAQPTPGPAADSSTPAQRVASANGTNILRLNFRGASLDMVLNYLSEAAGFIIVLETQPKGKVDVWSNQPLTRDEAVDLLDSVLKKNGYAAIRNGRTLTIVNRDEANTRDIPVKLGGEPERIPRNDEIVTQIVPVRFVEAAQLIKNLQPLVSAKTSITVNESGNSIVITDTQANIHKVAEIIQAIDSGAEDVTLVRVFHLKYADPTETADLLSTLFPSDTSSGGSQSPVRFGGGGFGRGGPGGGPEGFGGGNPGGGGGNTSNTQNLRIQKRSRVVVAAEPRTGSVVVSAAKDLMSQIEGVVAELDSNPAMKQTVHVIHLQNIDPQTVLPVLQDVFEKSGTANSRTASSQTSPLQSRITQQSQQTTSGTRTGTSGNSGAGGLGGTGAFGP